MNDRWKADHTTGETFPSLFELQCGFFYAPSGFSLSADNQLKNGYFEVWAVYFCGKVGQAREWKPQIAYDTFDYQATYFYILAVYF